MDMRTAERALARHDKASERNELEAYIASLIVAGDISKLDPLQRAWYYRARCEGLGLDPLSKPFDILKLNGKEILYLNRAGCDQLARIHKVNRKVIDGPRVIDVGGTKMVFCIVEASVPDGRAEQEVATVPFTDPLNALMKCVTKAKRRATIAVTGAGVLSEDELETIPAHALGAAPAIQLLDATDQDPTNAALDELRDRLAQDGVVPSFEHLVQVYDETVGQVGDAAVRAAGLRACYAHLEETLGAKGQRVKLKAAVDALERDRAEKKRVAAMQPVTPPAAAELPPIDQAEADFHAARSMDEVAAVAAHVASMKLPKGSPGQKRLAAAYRAAVARLTAPPDGPEGGGGKPANDTPAGVDDPERAAIEAEAATAPQARAGYATAAEARAAWEAHLTDGRHENAIAVEKSYAKHLAARTYAPLDGADLMRVAVARLGAFGVTELVAVAKLRNAVKAAEWRRTQPARPKRAAATKRLVA